MTHKSQISARRFGSRAGNTVVETALSLLLFLTIFLAIIEFGLGLFAYNFVSYAAREGALYAAVRGSLSKTPATADDVQTIVRNQAVALDSSQVTVTTTWCAIGAGGVTTCYSSPSGKNIAGNSVNVAVSYPISPLFGNFLLGNITVGSSARMTISQ